MTGVGLYSALFFAVTAIPHIIDVISVSDTLIVDGVIVAPLATNGDISCTSVRHYLCQAFLFCCYCFALHLDLHLWSLNEYL